MRGSLDQLLKPSPSIPTLLSHVREIILNRTFNAPEQTEQEIAIGAISELISGIICACKDNDVIDLCFQYSIIDSIELCILRGIISNSTATSTCDESCFESLSFKLDELRRKYREALKLTDNVLGLAISARKLVLRVRPPVYLSSVDVRRLSGVALLSPLLFPLLDLLGIMYPSVPKDLVPVYLFTHQAPFSCLSFIRGSLHKWGAPALLKRLHKLCFPSTVICWLCRTPQIISFMLSNGAKDSFVPQLKSMFECTIQYKEYLRFACSIPAPALSTTDISPIDTESLSALVEALGDYPILEEPEEYIYLNELIASSGSGALATFLIIEKKFYQRNSIKDLSKRKSLISHLRNVLAEFCSTYHITDVHSLILYLISIATISQDKLNMQEVTITTFSMLVCYFNLSRECAIDCLSVAKSPNQAIVLAILQLELLIIASFYDDMIDAIYYVPGNGEERLEIHHCSAGIYTKGNRRKDKEWISLQKILRLPLSTPVSKIFRSLVRPRLEKKRQKVGDLEGKAPFLHSATCEFTVEMCNTTRTISLLELLVLDMGHLGRIKLVDHVQTLLDCTFEDSENKVDAVLQRLEKNYGFPVVLAASTSSRSIAYYNGPAADNDQEYKTRLELAARAEFIWYIKHNGPLKISNLHHLFEHISGGMALFKISAEERSHLISWGIECGYLEVVDDEIKMADL